MPAHNIVVNPVHLGRNAAASAEPEFTGAMDWYAAYTERHQSDGVEGRLVSMFTFDKSWEMWEMHPRGSEVVLCTAGRITLLQEHPDGTQNTVVLTPGEYAINAPGTWHTADIEGDATAVFITAGLGTQHRPRRS
jgi:quercetin dioxygenase-like cupin family protein